MDSSNLRQIQSFPRFAGLSDWIERWSQRLTREPGSVVDAARRMRAVNPVIIPRNLKVEEALVAAESGDLEPTHRLLEVLKSPFSKTKENEPYQIGALPGSPAVLYVLWDVVVVKRHLVILRKFQLGFY